MKIKLPLLAGLASLAALVGAHAQTAVTDPVGYITLNVTGTAVPGSPAISYVGPSLVNKVEFAGAVVSSTANTVTFAATAFTAGAFGTNAAPYNQGLYYAEITSGANEGKWVSVVSNTASTITLSENVGADFAAGAQVKIRKHHTLASLFGDGSGGNPLKLTGGDSTTSADVLQIFRPSGLVQAFYNTDETAWTIAPNLANDYVLEPGVGVKVLRRGAATGIVLTGYVKTGPTQLTIPTGTSLVNVPRAVGTSLVFKDTNVVSGNETGSKLITSGLVGGDSSTGASVDIITQLLGTNVNLIYFNTDENAFFTGATNADLFTIPEGSAIRVQRKGAPFTWTVPKEPIAN